MWGPEELWQNVWKFPSLLKAHRQPGFRWLLPEAQRVEPRVLGAGLLARSPAGRGRVEGPRCLEMRWSPEPLAEHLLRAVTLLPERRFRVPLVSPQSSPP